jgi:hypothetical protein
MKANNVTTITTNTNDNALTNVNGQSLSLANLSADTTISALDDADMAFDGRNNPAAGLSARVQKARAAYSNSKEQASMAAAQTYMLWKETQATKETREWLEDVIAKRNAEISKCNSDLNQAKAKAAAGTKAKQDLGTKLSLITARDNTSKFLRIVKYALDFVRPNQASLISRYVLVLEWLDLKFMKVANIDERMLVKAIREAGGLENVVRIGRGQKVSSSTSNTTKKTDDVQSKYTTLKEAKSLKEIKLAPKHQRDGFVALIGRYVDGKVQVLGELNLSKKELDKYIAAIDEMNFPASPKLVTAA